jgi:enoyl-CoA hydratase/carnithine racemase
VCSGAVYNTSDMPDEILTSTEDRVALIQFNRPERNNAITASMIQAYFDALDAAAADPEVRAIVVTGAGKSFCVGADIEVLKSIDPSKPVSVFPSDRPHTYALQIPKPVIAAVNGPCAGLGLVHAVACDLRFAAAGAKMTTAFARRGLIAEYGLSWMLPRLAGTANAMDLLISGRTVAAEEALELGLVQRVAPAEELLDTTMAYAKDLARSCSPSSMAVIKKQVYQDLGASLEDAYGRARSEMAASLRRPDVKEGAASFMERRAPEFPPLG